MGYPWFARVRSQSALEQGDFIFNCPLIKPTPQEDLFTAVEPEAIVEVYDVVVMTNSCEMENHDIDNILLCPVYTLENFIEKNPDYAGRPKKAELRKKKKYGFFPTQKNVKSPFPLDYFIIDFREALSSSMVHVENASRRQGWKLRMLPPYREQLAQDFAQYIMRVASPEGIDHFEND